MASKWQLCSDQEAPLLHELLILGTWSTAVVLAIPLSTFCMEVLLGTRRNHVVAPTDTSYSACILMPAHNEVRILADTLDQLLPVLNDRVRLLVVADNCDDQTADVARMRSVAVVERQDATLRGKGFALAFGRERLRQSPPPDCVIILDADCKTDKSSLDALIETSVRRGLAVQASYTFESDMSAPPRVQISNFAVWLKNVVRQKGTQKLGGGAVLTGTGMAFPWAIFDTLPLATNSIVEDLELAVELTRNGTAPVFLESAQVTSVAASEEATLAQRARWEHGFLSIAQSFSLPTLVKGVKSHNLPLILLGLHLLVPPLALLMSVAVTIAIVLVVTAIWTKIFLPAVLVSGLACLVFCSVFLAWLNGGHRWLSGRSMLLAPLYVLWKLPIYLRFMIGRRSEWVRTDRNSL